jgi:RNA polymerase sigma-70 factor, ECF subfamily
MTSETAKLTILPKRVMSSWLAGTVPGVNHDSSLVSRAKKGERQAFHELYEAHGNRVHMLSMQIMGNLPAAENLTRDIFIQTFRGVHALSDECAFTRSLYACAIDTAIDTALTRMTGCATSTTGV